VDAAKHTDPKRSGGRVTPSFLGRSQIKALNGEFKPRDRQLWEDIEWLSAQFWDSDCDPIRGHHLLMAVGNFKRQAIIRLHDPLPRTLGEAPVGSNRETCEIGGEPLGRDDPNTWKRFCGLNEGVSGFGVATTTTLLSALWPGHHVIIDQRALRAFVALRVAQGLECLLPAARLATPSKLVEVKWDDYYSEGGSAYLGQVLSHVEEDVAPVEVERALFELDKRHDDKTHEEECRDWNTYGGHLLDIANGLAGAATTG